MTDCTICIENITKRNYNIKCLHCEEEACVTCYKRYICSSLNDPVCMYCKKDWDREFLHNSFPRSFIDKEYKKHRENVLFQRQIAMLQQTQPQVEKIIKVEKIKKEIADISEQIDKLQKEKWQMIRTKNNVSNSIVNSRREAFYGHCPKNGCNGFITGSWKCGVCETKTCKTCKEELFEDQEHECNEDTVKNIEMLRKDTKPCPECKIPIHKIEGCDVMFCVSCHVSFGWRTGEILRGGPMHNPHYLDWARNNRFHQNDGCTNVCNVDYMRELNTRSIEYNEDDAKFIDRFSIFINHCDDIERRRYNTDNCYENGKFLQGRILYMRNLINKEKFQRNIQQFEKKMQKHRDIYLVFDMFINVAKSILMNGFNLESGSTHTRTLLSTEKIQEIIQEIKRLIDYTNKSFDNLKKIYNNKTIKISFEFKTVYPNRYSNRNGVDTYVYSFK